MGNVIDITTQRALDSSPTPPGLEQNCRVHDVPATAKMFRMFDSPKTYTEACSACLLMVCLDGVWRAEITDVTVRSGTPLEFLATIVNAIKNVAWERRCVHITVASREVTEGVVAATLNATGFEGDAGGGFIMQRSRRK